MGPSRRSFSIDCCLSLMYSGCLVYSPSLRFQLQPSYVSSLALAKLGSVKLSAMT